MLQNKLKYILLISFLTLLSCNQKPVSEDEAKKLAYSALQEYSTGESINIKDFGDPVEVRYNHEVEVWEIYFESKTKSKHRINFLIDKFGNVEVHRSVDHEE